MKIKTWIVAEDIDRRDLAEKLGVTYTTLSMFCSGTRMPSAQTIAKLHNLSRGKVSFGDFYNLDPPIGTLEVTT